MKFGSIWTGVRYARIGLTSRVLQSFDQDAGRRYLVNELSRIPGLTGKFGQVLALRFGKPEWNDVSPPAMPLEWIKFKIEEKAPKLALEIVEIDPIPHVASIGQVHRARLKDGSEVAIKVRYEGVVQALNEQLELILGSFGAMPKKIGAHLRMDDYREFLRDFFNEELNYLKEGATQEKFRQVWIHQSKLVIPQVRMDLSTEEILVQSFEASRSLKELKDESCEVKASCSRLLSEFFVNGLLESGWIHTDLHPKNWGFRPEADQLVIYDFGATLKLNDQLRSALRSLAEGTAVSPIDCLNCYAQLGFDPMVLQEISHKLPEVSEIIFRPFRNASSGAVAFNFNQWRVGEDVEAVLGEKKWLFRTGGPPWFLMVIRGFGGWLLALQTLSDPFTASELFRPQEEQECQFRLRVQVIEGESEMVSIELPATSVYSLEGLLPDHVEIELLREGVSMSEIKKRAIHSGLVPQLLFETKKGNKSYKVWIE